MHSGQHSIVKTYDSIFKGGFKPFETLLPRSLDDWQQKRPQIRATLKRCLGEWPELFTPTPTIESRQQRDGYTQERLTFDNGVGDTVYGYMLIPDGHTGKGPAILYNHYHGNQYQQGKEEVITKVFDLLPFATGEELARHGYVVLCIDAYCFGERRFQGPAGSDEEGSATEVSLFKTFLWQGKTLWGMMIRDDTLALNYLASRPEVDPERIAAMGMSMGSTRTWWLAAMDERIKVAVSVACLTRYQNLIAEGGLKYHGIYYYVPNMLKEGIDAESVVALIAPRAHLTLTGASDTGSPAAGVKIINAYQEGLYELFGKSDHFRGVLYPRMEHVYTPRMWKETIHWLKKYV